MHCVSLSAVTAESDIGAKDRRPTYNSGVFFGHLIYLDPEGNYVFARPTDAKYSRQSFYLDKRTLFTRMEEGRGKRIKREDLIEGDKVAIRYFSRNELSLADEIFVVIGPFQAEVYQRRRGKRRRSARRRREGKEKKDEENAEKGEES